MPWSIPRSARPLAVVDVGSLRTRVWLGGHGLVLDEPTAVAVWADERRRPVLGSAALRAGDDDPEANVRRPVRNGRVVEDGAAVSLIRAMLRELRIRRSALLVMTVPVGADEEERRVLRRILRDAGAPRRQMLVDAPSAAAAGVGLLPPRTDPGLVVDVGAGLAEALAVDPGHPLGRGWCEIAGPERFAPLGAALTATRRALSQAPGAIVGGVTVTGGGAVDADLLTGLAAELGTTCRAAPEPGEAVVRGAALLAAIPEQPFAAS